MEVAEALEQGDEGFDVEGVGGTHALATSEAHELDLRQVEAALGGEGLTATAEEGYRRLAFGPVTDAVRLMFPAEDETPPLEEMDLYNISKISQAKGGLEITFFDRLEALDRLAAQQKETAVQQDAFGFLDAVAAGAAAGDEEDR